MDIRHSLKAGRINRFIICSRNVARQGLMYVPLRLALAVFFVVSCACGEDRYWSGGSSSSDDINQGDNWYSPGAPASGTNLKGRREKRESKYESTLRKIFAVLQNEDSPKPHEHSGQLQAGVGRDRREYIRRQNITELTGRSDGHQDGELSP